jgi:hypothetical protein
MKLSRRARIVLVTLSRLRHGRHARRQAHVRIARRHPAALAFALKFDGRKRAHNADELMSEIVAKRLVEHLERSGFVGHEAGARDQRRGAVGLSSRIAR